MKQIIIIIFISLVICSCASSIKRRDKSYNKPRESMEVHSFYSKDSLLQVYYGMASRRSASFIDLYCNKQKIEVSCEALGFIDTKYFCSFPYYFKIIKIEQNVYAIAGINRHEGANFRNLWIADFNKPKAQIKCAVVTCTTEGVSCDEMSMKADTANNKLELLLKVGSELRRHLLKDSTLYQERLPDQDIDYAFTLNNYHYFLVNGKEPAWEEVNLFKETGSDIYHYEYDIIFGGSSRGERCEPNPIKVYLKY